MKSKLPYNVMRHRDWDAAPRDPVTVGAAILGPSLTAATTLAGGYALGAAVVGYLATTAITSLVLSALAPKPSAGNQGQIVNTRDPAGTQEYVYGQVRKGGNIIFIESTGDANKYLHLVIALAGHECEEIGDIYINDEIVTLDGSGYVTDDRWSKDGNSTYIRIRKHDGSQTTADSALLSETSATAEFVGNGVAYIYVRLLYENSVFSGGIPTFTAVVKGRKVYDPRGTPTTAWTANAALCIRDYITSELGLADENVDDDYFSAAANDCDDDITLAAGGTEDRYQLNAVVNSSSTIGQALQDMVTACNGTLYLSGGEWRLRVGTYSAPVKSFTLDDFRSDISVETRASRRDNFNAVIGRFVSADDDWVETDFPPITSSTFLAEDGGEENQADLSLPMVTSASQAQRVAKQTLYRAREQITLTADFGLRALDVEVGDIIDLTIDDYGWSAKEFEVATWKLFIGNTGAVRVNMTLRETSEAAFDWDAEEQEIISNNSTLLRFDDVPNVGVSAVASTRIQNEKVTNFITVTVSSSLASQVDYVEVQYKLDSDDNYSTLGTGQLGKFEAIDLDNGTYAFRARAVNSLGYYGEWEYLTDIEALGDTDPPDNVSGFYAEANGQTLTLDWEPVTNLDLSYYRIRHAIEETGATWANATTAVDKVPRPGSSVSLPIRAGTYFIRAHDKAGLQSGTASSIVIPSELMPTFTNTSTQTDSTTFTGTKTGCSVVSGKLQITDTSSAPSEATYEFSTYIDTTVVGRRFCRIRAATVRHDDSSGLFDDLPGLFDSLAGLFDDFTGFTQIDDTNVLFYVATTDDDPSGSPTWSGWQQFRAGDFYGRAFRFKIVLKSTSVSVTPSIGTLQAIVEWN